MNVPLVAAAILLLFLAAALGWLFRRLVSRDEALPDAAWVRDFTVARYHPMERLLDEEDFRFLAGQAGYEPRIGRRLRRQRRRVLRAYLRALVRDFGRLHAAARRLLADSTVDRPDLGAVLVKQYATFHLRVFEVRFRLVMNAAGIGSVDVRGLLGSLECLNGECRQLASAHAGRPVW